MRPVRIVVSIENEVGWICQYQRKRKDKRKEDQRQAERAYSGADNFMLDCEHLFPRWL